MQIVAQRIGVRMRPTGGVSCSASISARGPLFISVETSVSRSALEEQRSTEMSMVPAPDWMLLLAIAIAVNSSFSPWVWAMTPELTVRNAEPIGGHSKLDRMHSSSIQPWLQPPARMPFPNV